ncbi:type II secretion system protein N [Salinisphaera aquimarina]|uniref:Type II secretion system protein N n=1 Tax=Salinisphaera aquimarina TaxID=2094031 RepID=A0ABV7ESR0_9GAMM
MKARIIRYALVGTVAFVIGLIAFLPARVVAGWAEQMAPISLGGVTGTIFNGHAAYASGPGGAVEDLNWTLHPSALLFARVSADIDIASDLDGFSATASRSLFGTTRLENVTGSASAGWLAKLGGYTFLPVAGDIGLDIREAAFDDALTFSALDGQIRVNNTRWQLFNPPVALGQFTTALGRSDQGVQLKMVDSNGPLAIDGQIAIDPQRRYQLDVRMRPRAGADERLGQMLDQLGRADAQGWHRVKENGQL